MLTYFSVLLCIYILTALFGGILKYPVIGLILVFGAVVGLMHFRKEGYIKKGYSWVFPVYLLIFNVVCFLKASQWRSSYDKLDIVAVNLFFGVIPLVGLLMYSVRPRDWDFIIARGVAVAVGLMALMIAAIRIRDGARVDVSVFSLGIPGLQAIHKNSVGLSMTALVIYYIFSARFSINSVWGFLHFVCLAFVFGTLYLLNSKTGLALVLVAALCRVRWYLGVAAGAVSFMLFQTLLYDSTGEITTAYQRTLLWNSFYADFISNKAGLLWGYGPGTFSSDAMGFGLGGKEAIHNYFLQFAHSFGIVLATGLVITLLFLLAQKRVWGRPSFYASLGFILHSCFDVGFVTGPGFAGAFVVALLIVDIVTYRPYPSGPFVQPSVNQRRVHRALLSTYARDRGIA